MATVELKDVTKSYGAVGVIRGIDLSIADGEFVVFVGPSGCGKSTLLRMIAGLEEISTGDVLIDDRAKYRHLWEEAGGIFIHHTSASSSIEALRQLEILPSAKSAPAQGIS